VAVGGASARLGRLVVGELVEERHQRVLGGDANEQLAVRVRLGMPREASPVGMLPGVRRKYGS
jgi:hypothetical protein